MNYPHLHLMVNHFPVVGALLALGFLVWALVARHRSLTRAALAMALIAGLSSWPATFTGEEAHEQVEDFPGFDHDLLHEHEEAAELAMYVMLGTAALALVGLVASRRGREVPKWAGAGTTLALLASTVLVARAAWAGGRVRHPEADGPLMSPPSVPLAVPLDGGRDAALPGTTGASVAGDSGKVHRHKDGSEHRH